MDTINKKQSELNNDDNIIMPNGNLNEYFDLEEEAFSDLDKYFPQLEKIEKANEIGNKVLSFIDNEMEHFNSEEFQKININEIVDKLNIKINKDIKADILTEIYSEIEQTFKTGGRISLEEYLNQGNCIYMDIQNRLKGEVDYSIEYSEEELKKEEEEAFKRFCTVLAMNNKQILSNCFDINKSTQVLLSKEEKYLNILNAIPFAESIEEKIEELNYIFFSIKQFDDLGCKITDDVNINNIITNKIQNMSMELSEYSKDNNITKRIENLQNNIENICNSNINLKDISLHTLDKLEIINESIYYKDLENENNLEL